MHYLEELNLSIKKIRSSMLNNDENDYINRYQYIMFGSATWRYSECRVMRCASFEKRMDYLCKSYKKVAIPFQSLS